MRSSNGWVLVVASTSSCRDEWCTLWNAQSVSDLWIATWTVHATKSNTRTANSNWTGAGRASVNADTPGTASCASTGRNTNAKTPATSADRRYQATSVVNHGRRTGCAWYRSAGTRSRIEMPANTAVSTARPLRKGVIEGLLHL